MICIKAKISRELTYIDDELKAIYLSKDSSCVWVFKSRESRNKFIDNTMNMSKAEREEYFINNYSN